MVKPVPREKLTFALDRTKTIGYFELWTCLTSDRDTLLPAYIFAVIFSSNKTATK